MAPLGCADYADRMTALSELRANRAMVARGHCQTKRPEPPISHRHAVTRAGHPAVLAGDYNVMPTDLDVYKAERWLDDALFRPEVRAAYKDLVDQGWTDALRTLHPGERIYTFWDYFRNAYERDAGLRIDHLLLSPAFSKRLAAAGVDKAYRGRAKPSDHAPTWVELQGCLPRPEDQSRS